MTPGNGNTDGGIMDSYERTHLNADLDGSGNGEGSGSNWSVPWSDLMMVMFVLFVVLFVYSSSTKNAAVLFAADNEAQAAEPEAKGLFTPIEGLIDRISGHAATVGANRMNMYQKAREIVYDSKADGVSVIMEADGSLRMTLRGDVFFASGKSQLDPRSREFLLEAADIVRLNQNMVHIIGHSDGTETGGQGAGGLQLSAMRAASVAQFLVQEGGLEARRFIVSGQGPFRPEVPATSDDMNLKNRRVEIVILTDLIPQS